MGIEGDIGFTKDDPWLKRLEEESRLAPFKSLTHAMNTSLSYQSGQIYEAEGAMFRAACVGVLAAGAAAAFYFSGRDDLAAFFALIALFCAFKFVLARGAKDALSCEVALMETRLLDAGFSLIWTKDERSYQPRKITQLACTVVWKR